jgi:hypothetical protein
MQFIQKRFLMLEASVDEIVALDWVGSHTPDGERIFRAQLNDECALLIYETCAFGASLSKLGSEPYPTVVLTASIEGRRVNIFQPNTCRAFSDGDVAKIFNRIAGKGL